MCFLEQLVEEGHFWGRSSELHRNTETITRGKISMLGGSHDIAEIDVQHSAAINVVNSFNTISQAVYPFSQRLYRKPSYKSAKHNCFLNQGRNIKAWYVLLAKRCQPRRQKQ